MFPKDKTEKLFKKEKNCLYNEYDIHHHYTYSIDSYYAYENKQKELQGEDCISNSTLNKILLEFRKRRG
jgi:hypothetical protein